MRDRHRDFEAAGVTVAAVGMGTPAMAAHFAAEQKMPFRLLVDHTKETYRAMEVNRGGLLEIAGPKVWVRGIKSLAKNRQGKPEQDPFQLGAVFAVAAGGKILLAHQSDSSSDNLDPDKLLAAFT